ncbi:MAG: hypothetical protein H0T46_21660 [Deltaproteobacteria bacterium]|nr:hypothetical protein [Deltaproteobacteria bacterium]
MLDGLFVTPAVTAINEALASAGAEGKLVVVGNAKLAAALQTKHTVIPVGLSPRAAKKLPGTLDDTSTLEAGSCAAVIGIDVTADDTWQAALGEWTRVVKDGGAIVLVDRGNASEASRRALCAGLTEIEQRHAGRAVVTSGLVSHLERT